MSLAVPAGVEIVREVVLTLPEEIVSTPVEEPGSSKFVACKPAEDHFAITAPLAISVPTLSAELPIPVPLLNQNA